MVCFGIIGAMEEEVEQLKDKMVVEKQIEKASMKFYAGKLHEQQAVIVRSGIGKVNAGICTQILVDEFDVTHIINTGIAGSLKNEIDLGDLVISEDTLHHDMDAEGFGYAPGQIPRMDVLSFAADKNLIELAAAANQKANPDIRTFTGRVVSGDQFISSREKKDQIKKLFDGYCTEMEGAAIGQAAYLNKIPFVIIRAISDKADQEAVVDYPAFERQAIRHSVRLMEQMMKDFQENR